MKKSFLSRLFHRHRWSLHSHTIHEQGYEHIETGLPFTEWEAGVVLRCRCGSRRHAGMGGFNSHPLALQWVRSLVTEDVPDFPPNEVQSVRQE